MYLNLSLLSITIFLLIIKKILFKNSKRKPPSPLSLPIIGHLHLLNKPLHQALAKISARFGPVISLRFGSRPVLVVSSASVAEECFTKNDVVFANRVQLLSLKHISYNFTSLAFSNYGPLWRNSRRIATIEVLSSHRLSSFVDVRASEVNAMIRRLFHEADLNGSLTKLDVKSLLFEFSMNNLMTMIGGKRPNNSKEVKRFQEMVEETFKILDASNIGDFLPVLGWLDLQGTVKKSKQVQDYRNNFLQKMIDEHRNTKAEQEEDKTMIGNLLSMQKTDPEHYSDHVIKAFTLDLLTAGTDTTSNAMEWAMSQLLNNPEKLKRVQIEIDELVKNERLIQESDMANLPYLECVIKETYRLYPGGPLLVPHENSEDCIVAGYDIPKGTMLLVNAYAIQRDGSSWKDANEFVPERFFEKEGVNMLTFGMGRRKCPGEGMANKVVGLVLGRMIQCFEWERVGEELVDLKEGFGMTLPKLVPLEAMYRPRECMKMVWWIFDLAVVDEYMTGCFLLRVYKGEYADPRVLSFRQPLYPILSGFSLLLLIINIILK